MPTTVFYPSLSNLLPIDRIPASLGGVKDGIENIFDKFFYKDLIVEKSASGDAAFYKLTLVVYNRLGFEIPGTGVTIWFNRPADNNNPTDVSNSEIPISLNYRLEILKYVRSFSQSTFSGDASAFFELFLEIADADPHELIRELISVFINDTDPIQKFVTDFNTKYAVNPQPGQTFSALTISTDPNLDKYQDLYRQMEDQDFDLSLGIFTDYINTLNSFDGIFDNIKVLFASWLGEVSLDEFKKILIPQFTVSIDNITIGIEFPADIFREIDNTANPPVPYSPDRGSLVTVNLGSINYSNESGFEFNNQNNFSFPLSEFMRTGFYFDVANMKLDFSRTKNIPEAIADGRPTDFIGVYIEQADLFFPASWNPDSGSTAVLRIKNMLAGTGGVSGKVLLEAVNPNDPNPPVFMGTFGTGFAYTIDTFNLEVQQNAFVTSEIQGTLTVPGFQNTVNQGPVTMDIDINLYAGGEFDITTVPQQNAPIWEIANVLQIKVNSAAMGRKNNRFYIGVSGEIDFIANLPGNLGNILPKGVEVKKLIIWDDGQIEFEGGTLILPNAVALKVGPVKLAVTALSMGSYEGNGRKYRYVGFDGGISVSPGGVDARANGVKVFYSVDGVQPFDLFVRIEGIAIDLIIPGSAKPEDAAVILSGFLSMKEPDLNAPGGSDAGTEYTGSVAFSLPRAHITGSAGMRLQPKWPAFLIDASMELATPIPLGSTGLSIYGFRGLIGYRYVASKDHLYPDYLPEDASWYQYYKVKVPPTDKEGIQLEKFTGMQGFSLGAGVSLATGADQGKAFSSKLFLLLSLPEVMLLQGQGAIMRERIGLDTTQDPPFSALISVTKQSIEAAFGVNYKLPEESGKIATVDGLIELGFFFGNSSAWYINVGRDLPAEKRVRARILSLFDAYFYLMLSSGGIRAGAGASWAFSKTYGPVGVEAGAYIDLAGRISFKPKQIGGSIQLGGYARINVFKFKMGFSIAASLAAEAPKPFIVTGSVCVAVNLPKPLKDLNVCLDFTWTFDASLNTDPQPVIDDSNISLKPPGKALNMATNETFTLLYQSGLSIPIPDSSWNNYIVPMDSFIDIEFAKNTLPDQSSATVSHFGGYTSGAEYTEMIPPQRGKSDQVKHAYEVKNIHIKYYDNGWQDYDLFGAYVDLNDPLFSQLTAPQLAQLKYGYWQKDSPNKYNKLRILAQHTLSFLLQGTGNIVPEELGITPETLFCDEVPIPATCINFDPVIELQNITSVPAADTLFYRGVMLKLSAALGVVMPKPGFNFNNGLAITSSNELEIILPEASVSACLSLSGNDASLSIEYYKRIDTGTPDNSSLPVYTWDLVDTTIVTPATLEDTICYNEPNEPIDRILIKTGYCNKETNVITCSSALTVEATALEAFLNRLVSLGQLFTSFDIYPTFNSEYETYFQGTVLYMPGYLSSSILYTIQMQSPTQLVVVINDGISYNCTIVLELQTFDSQFDITAIWEFSNLRADSDYAATGYNYHFLVDAITGSGTFTMKGESCYPITSCIASCDTWLHQICYLPISSYEYNQTIPSQTQVTAENNAMLDGLLKITPPVWRPYTDFFIQVETKDTISNINNPPLPVTSYYGFGFRTAGPVGHFHEYVDGEFINAYNELKDVDKTDQFRLANLKPYIDFSTSYPNADGNILGAKPLFYAAPKLLLFYKYAQVYTMLRNWAPLGNLPGTDILFDAIIKDPAEALNSPDTVPATLTDSRGTLANDLQTLGNMIENGNPCSGIDGPLEPAGIQSQIALTNLLPEKLYTAIYFINQKADDDVSHWTKREVHRYPFQTSRYANFTEQVESYILSDEPGNEKYASFYIDLDLTSTQVSDIQAVINGTENPADPLLLQYANPLDRIMNGILALPQLAPAQTTEFNIIRDRTNRNNIIGILVRNPEPFNDPKLPLSELNSTLTLSVNGGATTGYTTLFSKDRSNIYITNAGSNISTGSAAFTLTYKLYDGYTYIVVTSATATITI
ncbi:MAG: hypothetical protein ACK5Z2_00170 [Bacteroidota bacterium]|jgi:hypothetical protein